MESMTILNCPLNETTSRDVLMGDRLRDLNCFIVVGDKRCGDAGL
jgi:hypothetical protein